MLQLLQHRGHLTCTLACTLAGTGSAGLRASCHDRASGPDLCHWLSAEGKEQAGIEEYSLSQTTLEQASCARLGLHSESGWGGRLVYMCFACEVRLAAVGSHHRGIPGFGRAVCWPQHVGQQLKRSPLFTLSAVLPTCQVFIMMARSGEAAGHAADGTAAP